MPNFDNEYSASRLDLYPEANPELMPETPVMINPNYSRLEVLGRSNRRLKHERGLSWRTPCLDMAPASKGEVHYGSHFRRYRCNHPLD